MEFRILGPLEVVDEGQWVDLAAGKQRALLAILLLRANEVVSTDELIDGLWGDRPPVTAAKSIQIYISQLRKALGNAAVITRPPGYSCESTRTSSTFIASSSYSTKENRHSSRGARPTRTPSCAKPSPSGTEPRSPTSPTSPSLRRRSPVSRSCTSMHSRSASRPTSHSVARRT